MFGWRKEILQRLEKIERLLEGKVSEIGLLKAEIVRLQGNNKELLDRLMSRDFEQYKIYLEPGEAKEAGKRPSLYEDEDLAGEIIEVPDET